MSQIQEEFGDSGQRIGQEVYTKNFFLFLPELVSVWKIPAKFWCLPFTVGGGQTGGTVEFAVLEVFSGLYCPPFMEFSCFHGFMADCT